MVVVSLLRARNTSKAAPGIGDGDDRVGKISLLRRKNKYPNGTPPVFT